MTSFYQYFMAFLVLKKWFAGLICGLLEVICGVLWSWESDLRSSWSDLRYSGRRLLRNVKVSGSTGAVGTTGRQDVWATWVARLGEYPDYHTYAKLWSRTCFSCIFANKQQTCESVCLIVQQKWHRQRRLANMGGATSQTSTELQLSKGFNGCGRKHWCVTHSLWYKDSRSTCTVHTWLPAVNTSTPCSLRTSRRSLRTRLLTFHVLYWLKPWYGIVWYGIVEFNIPLDIV